MARPVRVRYERDEAGVQALLLSDGMAGLAVHVASRAKRHAEGLSRPFMETGDYARSFKVVPVGIIKQGRMAARMGAVLINESSHAANVEWGGKKGGHKVLTRTRQWVENEYDGRAR